MLSDKLQLYKINKILKRINQLSPKMKQMSDSDLKKQTAKFKTMLSQGENLDDILIEAFATVREVDYRVLGMFPYDVQVMGAIALSKGFIAEMKTGEGKTLTATMPLYLNALTGQGAMLVTTNDYLAQRDGDLLRPVYENLDLTVSIAVSDKNQNVSSSQKRQWYNSDIVYTTASSLAFDYLFNNLITDKEDQYMRPFNYAVIDEVDDVLLDQAEMPLIVASKNNLQSNLYELTDTFVNFLKQDRDYIFKDNKRLVWLTYYGVKKAEKYFRIENLFSADNRELYRHIILALKAHYCMVNRRDYAVIRGKVVLFDERNGRLQKGVQISTGLHQAIETKEKVSLSPTKKSAATITFPGLFNLFNKIAGMSGTAKTNEEEFLNTYNMKVICIPTNKPIIRKNYRAKVFLTTSDKLLAAIKKTISLHETGRPVLLVTGSVENSEIVSELLLNYGVANNVLNAFNIPYEAKIIANAGKRGAVTIATNMAGRGTDIKLSSDVKKLGGLAVIGTEMLSKRMQLQLSGRAGRQGDPGSSQFYISLEDDYVAKDSTFKFKKGYRRLFNAKKKGKKIIQLHSPLIKLSLKLLQERIEEKAAMTRMVTNLNAKCLGKQRELFYIWRNNIIKTKNLENEVADLIDQVIDIYLKQTDNWDAGKIKDLVNNHITYQAVDIPEITNTQDAKKVITKISQQVLEKKKKKLINNQQLNKFYHQVYLHTMDILWTDQVYYMERLPIYTNYWQVSGHPSEYIYQKWAYESFLTFESKLKQKIAEEILLSTIYIDKKNNIIVEFV
ncbi:preprotein translocase subunit SecA [Lactobacillus colini]|uniref:Protein translocase subunit SecA n=1 Tax=Lactobacillus colini TaxID=1819254 RepID=A0ABS4MGN5_9LACO|nr:accessory Sec system translocase SecA2 [Lactobacillus colini]MBP2058871.1 preprotein translocase subunit SecA [Lactobacillus colini]